MALSVVRNEKTKVSAEEWAARVELAACYRLVEMYGWGEGIYNHISVRVPGEPDMMLMKHHAITYEEVTASNLVKVSINGDLDERAGINRPGYTVHSALLRARKDVNCGLHLHTQWGVAMSAHPKGLRMLTQHATRFHNRVGYHDYYGITENLEEQESLIRDFGNNRAMIMRHHGLFTVGATVGEAFALIKELIEACKTQLLIEATGHEPLEIPPELCEKVAVQFEHHDRGRGTGDWPAQLRRLDRLDPSYKD